MALASGIKLGPYELGASIGAGGMGEVYRAHDARLGRDVAIKIISASLAQDAGRVQRFEQEARAAAALNHPNILAVYDIGTHDGSPYIVSELLEGATLRDRLREGPLPMRKVVDYALQIARGLAAAHDRGIVHRDLKPDNIFITNDGRAKILDFGLAKLTRRESGVDDLTRTIQSEPGMVLGTVGYMSPEQVRGKDADARSDVFSFGAVLYEMVSGLRAFKGDSSADILSAILKEEPQDLTDINASVSPALDRIVRHCLEKNPAERFQSAHDLAFDLETLSSISKPSKEMPPPPKTRPWLWPAIAVLLLALAGLASYIVGRSGRASSAPEFRQLTFRSGTVYRARFTSDGNSILYTAAWEGNPLELFTSRSDSVEARSLAHDTLLAAISSRNQLAVLLKPSIVSAGSVTWPDGTLALLPLEGGAPRPLAQHVQYADWTPDGSELAVIRAEDQSQRLGLNFLQFPIDTTIYTPQNGWLSHVRFSPDGKYLAFEEHVPAGDDGKLVIVDRSGKKVAESPHYNSINSHAWASNQEVWFAATPGSDSRSLRAMDLRGQIRDVYRAPGDLTIHDIAANGRVLLTADTDRLLLMGGTEGSPDKDLSWLGWSLSAAISDDGSSVVFSESGAAVGGNAVTFVRTLDRSSPPIELGSGLPTAISPDGKWVATLDLQQPQNIVLLPTGVGKPVQLTSNGWHYTRGMYWMPDDSALLVNGAPPGQKVSVYRLDIQSKQLRRILPEGIRGGSPAPDGKRLLGWQGNSWKIYNLAGAEVATLPPLSDDDRPDHWSGDGNSVFVWNLAGKPRLDRVDIASGKRVPLYSIGPPDNTGIVSISLFRVSKDGKSHAYSALRLLTDLFVVQGLR